MSIEPVCAALSGRVGVSQGDALGWYVPPFQGERGANAGRARGERGASAGRPLRSRRFAAMEAGSESEHMDQADKTRAGIASIVGRPNVGKSTLLNRILGGKLAIVSHRPQTTRNHILGIRTWNKDQLVLLDTPGIHRGRAHLNRYMVSQAMEALDGVDCILLMTEVHVKIQDDVKEGKEVALHPDDAYVLEQVLRRTEVRGEDGEREAPPIYVVINKIDRLQDRRVLLPLTAAWQERGFEHISLISALEGDGTDDLIDQVRQLLPEGPHLYPEEMLTDRAERFVVAELIREQVFLSCRQEVPYSTAVEITRYSERERQKDVFIEAIIHTERDSQKAILVGKKGSMIKRIGMAAREEITNLLDCKVHLKLTVHVEKNWTDTISGRRRLGYE